MVIKLNNAVICAGGKQSPSQFRISEEHVFQLKDAIGARASHPVPRQNTKTRISFSVSIEHASVLKALEACVNAAVTKGKAGTLFIIVAGSTKTLLNAAVQNADHTFKGVSSYHTYSIIGGEFNVTS